MAEGFNATASFATTFRTHTGRAVFASIHFQSGPLSNANAAASEPQMTVERRDDISYLWHHRMVDARNASVVQSRHHNVKLDRPKNAACYRALGCPPGSPQKLNINVNKQEDNPLNFCGETAILQRFIVGLSPRLLAVRDVFERFWVGDQRRLAALLDYRSPYAFVPGSSSPLPQAHRASSSFSSSSSSSTSTTTAGATPPNEPARDGRAVFDLAVHVPDHLARIVRRSSRRCRKSPRHRHLYGRPG